MSKAVRLGLIVLVVGLAILWGAYAVILWEGSSARGAPPGLEASVAQWLLRQTVLYRQKCELCHGYNGAGKTEIGAGQYPHPPDLRGSAVQSMSDGELFFHITNGIRHTGMPAWSLTERRGWQLVLFLRQLPRTVTQPGPAAETIDLAGAHYVGSKACEECHRPRSLRFPTPVTAVIWTSPVSGPPQRCAPGRSGLRGA